MEANTKFETVVGSTAFVLEKHDILRLPCLRDYYIMPKVYAMRVLQECINSLFMCSWSANIQCSNWLNELFAYCENTVSNINTIHTSQLV